MYRVLYRKWRPQTFSDVIGQEHITSTLAHEIESGKVSHAYLFTGSRGTGKTTCAKIFAKAVNCSVRESFCLQLWLYEYLYKKLKSLLAVIDRTYSSRLSRCHFYLNFCPVIVTTYSVCLNCLLKNCRSVNILQE